MNDSQEYYHSCGDNCKDETNLTYASDNISLRNCFNFLAFILCCSLSFGVCDPFSEVLTSKNRTLFTPAPWCFYIWILIYVSQGIFALFQLFPQFRTAAIVYDGVKFWYLPVCLFQLGWLFTILGNKFYLSFVMAIMLEIVLLCLIRSQYNFYPQYTVLQYLLFCLPFEIHFGWNTGLGLLNLNIIMINEGESIAVQLIISYLSLIILITMAISCMFILDRPNYSIPLVLSWITIGIVDELRDEDDTEKDVFGMNTVIGIRKTAIRITIAIWVLIVIRFFASQLAKRKTNEQYISEYVISLH